MGDPVQTEEETRNDLLEAQKTVSKTESISARQVSQKVAKSASQIQQQGKGTSSASAIRTYSKLYRAGEYDKAIELLKSLTKKDNPYALYLMADMYFRGLGVKRDTKQAFLLFERSALLDYSKAQAKVAYHYLAGTGTNKNLDKAHNWALKSAVQGDALGQEAMGLVLAEKDQSDKGLRHTVKWFKAAYKNGVSEAGNNHFAYIYYTGSAGFVDRQTAMDICHKEAHAGNSASQVSLGHAYADGKDVFPSDKVAARWYREAAENGNPVGMFQLGLAYYHSVGGVTWDYDTAYMWFSLADEQGDEDALVYKDKLAKQLTKERLQKGDERVAECRKRKFKGC